MARGSRTKKGRRNVKGSDEARIDSTQGSDQQARTDSTKGPDQQARTTGPDKQAADSPTMPRHNPLPPIDTVPIPVPLIQNPVLRRPADPDALRLAIRDNPNTITLRFERIADVDGDSYPITAGYYTTKDQPPLSARPLKPYPLAIAGRSYEIRRTGRPGKGKGMFALDSYAAGRLIACERPLLIAALEEADVAPEWEYALMEPTVEEAAIARMPAETRRLLLMLHNSRPKAHSVETGIAQTNGFNANSMPGCIGRYGVIFNDLSWINHSCVPNAVYHWDPESLTGEVRAVRRIAIGQEVTIASINIIAPYRQRQDLLRDNGDICKCTACSLPPAERDADDKVRLMAETLAGASLPAVNRANALETAKFAGQAAKHVYEAQLDHPLFWETVSRSLVAVACVHGDKAGAMRWAKTAAWATQAAIGTDGGWDAVAVAPQKTEWWRTGQRQ
ncbi:hypothetical protein FA95DRAFT_1610153 [Auriscalpium vulgare]|uniref:Uncharacterized protein n=1 Tax=Auriscalpium vulgare TaxID=40419 RepID=A0ACB8RE64_9AGAM|nr:hypothetical protein FA95DRAFT_1610153 [Auriscalpium vulgare]